MSTMPNDKVLQLSDIRLSEDGGMPTSRMFYSHRIHLGYDVLEFNVGMERGWLDLLKDQQRDQAPLLCEDVDEQVFQLFQDGLMALCPTDPDIDIIHRLYCRNGALEMPVYGRHKFLDVLPSQPYHDYKILPPYDPQPQALFLKGTLMPPPFDGLDQYVVRTKLHPCFMLTYAGYYHLNLLPIPEVRDLFDPNRAWLIQVAYLNSLELPKASWIRTRLEGRRQPPYYLDPVPKKKANVQKPKVLQETTNPRVESSDEPATATNG